MWRLVLLAASVVAVDERWSRQATDRRINDWIPVNSPTPSSHQHQHQHQHQPRAVSSDQQPSAASVSLPSVLTPPAAQSTNQHPRLLPPPPQPDGFFQQAASNGFLNSFPPLFNEKPRQFLPPPSQNPRPQSSRFQQNLQQQQQQTSQLADTAGIPPHLFQVGPHQFSNNDQTPHQSLVSAPQFLGPQFLQAAQPQQPFVTLTGPQVLQQTIPNFQEFQLQNNQPIYLQQPAAFGQPPPPPPPSSQLVNRPASQQSPNATKSFKFPDHSNEDKEVQLLYVPVETLRQRGRTLPTGRFQNVRGNSFNGNQNSFEQAHANSQHQLTKTQFRGQKPQEIGAQIFSGSNGQLLQNFQEPQPPKNFFQETSGPRFPSQTPKQFFQETSAPNLQTTPKQFYQETPAPQVKSQPSSLSQQYIPEHTTAYSGLDLQSPSSGGISVTPGSLDVSSTVAKSNFESLQNDGPSQTSERYNSFNQFKQELSQESRPQKQEPVENYQTQNFNNENIFSQQYGFDDERRLTTLPPPHQPPLSVYMETNAHSKIGDVLTLLKSSKTIPVLDTVGPDSPQVFVGPSNLSPPSGYLKFELPYLSSLDNNRVERKVDRLPFFVAPLNFQPPPGYSKIPFPAPHIGSVVVSNLTVLRTALHDKPFAFDSPIEQNTPSSADQPYTLPDDISPISPQLPSLINSLQDDNKYYQSTTTELPVTTTPAFPRRNTQRGPHRGYSSTTTTEEPPTRRPVNRQRRPYNTNRHSNRVTQPVSSTTPEPIITTLPPQNEHPQNDEQKFYSDFTTENIQQNFNQNFRQPVYETPQRVQFSSQNQGAPQLTPSNNQQNQFTNQFAFNSDSNNNNQQFYQNEPVQPEFKQQLSSQEQQYIQSSEENIKVPAEISNPFYNTPKSFTPEQTTEEALSELTQQITTESQRILSSTRDNGQRRDPLRQRFRGRNPHHSTTEQTATEPQEYQPKVKTNSKMQEQQYLQQTVQYNQNNNNYNGQLSNYPSNTERSDEQSVTESDQAFKITYPDTDSRASPSPINKDIGQSGQFYNQFQEQQQTPQQQQQFNANVGQQQFESSTFAQENPVNIQQNVNSQQQVNEQSFSNSQLPTSTFQNSQQAFDDSSMRYDSGEMTDKPINQQRLTKYTRTRGRGGQGSREQIDHDTPTQFNSRNREHTYASQQNKEHDQPSLDNSYISTTESEAEKETPKPVTVRVRGRVRGRTRSNVRQSTTTERPNYPEGVLNEEEQIRKPYRNSAERGSSNRHTYRSRTSTTSESSNDGESSTHASDRTTTESGAAAPVSRTYNHILNRNKVRRPIGTTASERHVTVQSTTPSYQQDDSNTKYLLRTTRKPQTTKLTTGRGRIRRPSKTAITTTELTPVESERDSFAPSAASNEVIDPYYSNQNTNYNTNTNNNNFESHNEKYLVKQQQQNRPVASYTETSVRHRQTSPATNSDEDYWNQAVTIQQSNSYDFSAESSPVTQSTLSGQYFNDEYYDHKQTPTYNQGPVYNPSHDQTPFSSNEQLVAFGKSKSKVTYEPAGKVNQWNEKEEPKEEQYDIDGKLITDTNQGQGSLYGNHHQSQSEEKIPNDNMHDETKAMKHETVNKEMQITDDGQIAHGGISDEKTTKDSASNPTKLIDPVTGKKPGRRRGAWVRVRVNKKPHDVFETAESQNLGSITNNAIKSAGVKDTTTNDKEKVEEYTIPANHRPTDPYSSDGSEMDVVEPSTTTTTSTEPPAVDYEKTLTDMIRDMLKEQQEEDEDETPAQEPAVKENESKEETEVHNKENITVTTSSSIVEDITASNEEVAVTTDHDVDLAPVTVLPEITTVKSVPEVITERLESSTDIVTSLPRVLGTSTTTEISMETEICYRGRCVKSKKNKKKQPQPESFESDLMPVE